METPLLVVASHDAALINEQLRVIAARFKNFLAHENAEDVLPSLRRDLSDTLTSNRESGLSTGKRKALASLIHRHHVVQRSLNNPYFTFTLEHLQDHVRTVDMSFTSNTLSNLHHLILPIYNSLIDGLSSNVPRTMAARPEINSGVFQASRSFLATPGLLKYLFLFLNREITRRGGTVTTLGKCLPMRLGFSLALGAKRYGSCASLAAQANARANGISPVFLSIEAGGFVDLIQEQHLVTGLSISSGCKDILLAIQNTIKLCSSVMKRSEALYPGYSRSINHRLLERLLMVGFEADNEEIMVSTLTSILTEGREALSSQRPNHVIANEIVQDFVRERRAMGVKGPVYLHIQKQFVSLSLDLFTRLLKVTDLSTASTRAARNNSIIDSWTVNSNNESISDMMYSLIGEGDFQISLSLSFEGTDIGNGEDDASTLNSLTSSFNQRFEGKLDTLMAEGRIMGLLDILQELVSEVPGLGDGLEGISPLLKGNVCDVEDPHTSSSGSRNTVDILNDRTEMLRMQLLHSRTHIISGPQVDVYCQNPITRAAITVCDLEIHGRILKEVVELAGKLMRKTRVYREVYLGEQPWN